MDTRKARVWLTCFPFIEATPSWERQFAVPAGIPVQLSVRLSAPFAETTSVPASREGLYHIFIFRGVQPNIVTQWVSVIQWF